MVKKAVIIVEKFNEGITIRWSDADGIVGDTKALAANGNEARLIGKQIWEDLEYMLNDSESEKVKMTVEYEKV